MIADLHCDLLSYLAGDEKRNPYHEESRCSISQLRQGNVNYQVLAVFTQTGKRSVAFAEKQFTIFRTLPKLYPGIFERVKKKPPSQKARKKSRLGLRSRTLLDYATR